MKKGADLVVQTATAIQNNNCPQTPQEINGELKSAPKIFKEDCKINWNQSRRKVVDFIRGLSPYPAAWSVLDGKILKISKVTTSVTESSKGIGEFESDGKTYLRAKTSDVSLDITELQIEGKKRMDIAEFLRGYQFQ